MSRVTYYLRVGTTLLLMTVLVGLPLRAAAATATTFSVSPTPKVIITEIQTAGATASQEFVEFYNPTNTDIDFADAVHGGKEAWKLQFFSATGTTNGTPDWTKPSATISLTGTLPAGGYYLLSSNGYAPGGIDSDQSYSSRLSNDGGGMQLVTASSTATTVHDRLMWKQSADGVQLAPAQWPTPVPGASLQRLPTEEDTYLNEDAGLTAFVLAEEISPKDIWHLVLPEETTPEASEEAPAPGMGNEEPDTAPVIQPEPLQNSPDLLPPVITELLPNPAAPLKDETDEFIELYNLNDVSFNLKGYTLQVGTTTLHEFTFSEDYMLAGGTYTAFYSRDTRLSLTNTGGQARVLSPNGTLLAMSDSYMSAGEDGSWSLTDGKWQWSTTATPGLINVITAPIATTTPKAAAKTAAVKAPAKKATARTASAKVKGSNTTKAKKKSSKKPKKTEKPKLSTVAQTAAEPQRAPVHNGILVAVAVVAVLYAAYEYRSDISNRFYKLRHHRAVRFLNRK